MPEIARLTGVRDWIDLDVVERERTPQPAMALGIQSYLAGLSPSNTIDLLDALGVQRSRKAIHDWVRKADLQPEAGQSPNQIALDETVIRVNDQQFRLYAAGDPKANDLLHVRLFSTTTTALIEMFLRELREKHDVESAVFLVDEAQHRQTALRRVGPISDVSPRKSERCRTDFSSAKTPDVVVFELLQSRRTSHCRVGPQIFAH